MQSNMGILKEFEKIKEDTKVLQKMVRYPGDYIYDAWKENPKCLKCSKRLESTVYTKCEECRKV